MFTFEIALLDGKQALLQSPVCFCDTLLTEGLYLLSIKKEKSYSLLYSLTLTRLDDLDLYEDCSIEIKINSIEIIELVVSKLILEGSLTFWYLTEFQKSKVPM
jgi:hypothetical protein